MSTVEAPPSFSSDTCTALAPLRRTRLVCTAGPSRTLATSARRTTRPSTWRIGSSAKSATAFGLALSATLYSVRPSRSVPEGSVRFCADTAALTSAAVRPKVCSAFGSSSTITCREAPP